MNENVNLNENPVVPEEILTDPRTGKTISRKKAAILAIGAGAAGSVLNDMLANPATAEIFVDTDHDGVSDTIVSDTNADGIYEITEEPGNIDNSEALPTQSPWSPNTAPMAPAGTISDDMSFGEAFSAAREELGAGGVFAWRGEYYNTFYEEELNDQNEPQVEFEVTDAHGLEPLDDYETPYVPENEGPGEQEEQSGDPEMVPGMMAADYNVDGVIDEIYVDLNQDGSADAAYSDMNQDGQFTEDEVILIHDPESLTTAEIAADPSMMSVDSNADGVDDILVADVTGDQVADAVGIDQNNDQLIDESEVIILDPEAMGDSGFGPAEVEYSGEVATDMPEDVSEDVLDQMSDDVASLEDNFDEINNWS